MADVKIVFTPTETTKHFVCAPVKLREGETDAVKLTADSPEATVSELTAKYLRDNWPELFGGKKTTKAVAAPKENK